MNVEAIKEEYTDKMEKALRRGDFALFENLRRQYDRLMQAREEVPAKKITDIMTPEDRETCNKLLRKIPVLADIAEGAGIDLLALLRKYDDTVTLPMILELKRMNYIAKSLRSLVDKVGSRTFAESFGDTCDMINEQIERIFEENK